MPCIPVYFTSLRSLYILQRPLLHDHKATSHLEPQALPMLRCPSMSFRKTQSVFACGRAKGRLLLSNLVETATNTTDPQAASGLSYLSSNAAFCYSFLGMRAGFNGNNNVDPDTLSSAAVQSPQQPFPRLCSTLAAVRSSRLQLLTSTLHLLKLPAPRNFLLKSLVGSAVRLSPLTATGTGSIKDSHQPCPG